MEITMHNVQRVTLSDPPPGLSARKLTIQDGAGRWLTITLFNFVDKEIERVKYHAMHKPD